MGKNKKWKRKAKRIKGECIRRVEERVFCENCIYDITDDCICIIVNTNHSPYITPIRNLERICKYGK